MQERVDLCLRISYRLFAPWVPSLSYMSTINPIVVLVTGWWKPSKTLPSAANCTKNSTKAKARSLKSTDLLHSLQRKMNSRVAKWTQRAPKMTEWALCLIRRKTTLLRSVMRLQRFSDRRSWQRVWLATALKFLVYCCGGSDPRAPLDGFRESCVEQIRDEVDLLESSLEQYEKVLRGTYGTLCDHKDYQTITVITGVWNDFVERSRKSPGNENKPAVEVIKDGLIAVLSDVPRAFEMTKKMKEERERAEQENKVKTKKLEQKSPWKAVFVTAASVAVSVGLIAGAFLFFQKKWRK